MLNYKDFILLKENTIVEEYLSVKKSKRLRNKISTSNAIHFWWRVSGTAHDYRLSTRKPWEEFSQFYHTFGKDNVVPTYSAEELLDLLPEELDGKNLQIGKRGILIRVGYQALFYANGATLIEAIYYLIINHHKRIYGKI